MDELRYISVYISRVKSTKNCYSRLGFYKETDGSGGGDGGVKGVAGGDLWSLPIPAGNWRNNARP